MSALSQADLKALEQTRQRLVQLLNSLGSLQQNLIHSDPLPSWASLHSLSTILSQNLASLTAHLSTHAPLLASTTVYPLPNFPSQTEEVLLTQLLRKKLEPSVADWVAEARSLATDQSQGVGKEEDKRLGERDLTELWEWAGPSANELARKRLWDDDEYTLEEREAGIEHVVTGLKRSLEDSDEEEDSDEDEGGQNKEGDEMEVVEVRKKDGALGGGVEIITGSATGPPEKNGVGAVAAMMSGGRPWKMEEMLRFMSTGVRPAS
ncbi:MAG: mediator of RNA polymerase II transcription subunit 8 [Caeruleum heppii]|nr:MAG: mediator of RNA polymerase II transcription subunit 8 [Caeruleum heppii]